MRVLALCAGTGLLAASPSRNDCPKCHGHGGVADLEKWTGDGIADLIPTMDCDLCHGTGNDPATEGRPNMNTKTQATLTLFASIACAFATIWHPWAAFVGAAFAAFTPREFSPLAFMCIGLNAIAFVVGLVLWGLGAFNGT